MSVTAQTERAHWLEESLYKTDYPDIKTIWVERQREELPNPPESIEVDMETLTLKKTAFEQVLEREAFLTRDLSSEEFSRLMIAKEKARTQISFWDDLYLKSYDTWGDVFKFAVWNDDSFVREVVVDLRES